MKSFKPNEKIKDNAYIGSIEKYNEIYDYSIKNLKVFGLNKPNEFLGLKNGKVWNWDFNKAEISWFEC